MFNAANTMNKSPRLPPLPSSPFPCPALPCPALPLSIPIDGRTLGIPFLLRRRATCLSSSLFLPSSLGLVFFIPSLQLREQKKKKTPMPHHPFPSSSPLLPEGALGSGTSRRKEAGGGKCKDNPVHREGRDVNQDPRVEGEREQRRHDDNGWIETNNVVAIEKKKTRDRKKKGGGIHDSIMTR
ncbi:hypothetical protein L249_3970 [Ophiocordyceps polyrhachis-furcata BCC 54312]|uniref:Uncharacterized protein n=1 Tax=Ophiocordyceps polyrhachis-furcata BCC 54312 TaxID=1330021 RepID=A0A367L5K3_9HYPO|nr:hypothetical protein L249_3970 [Ophiocordyceps polyrhachis-furcata BCC 54312]